MTMQRNATGVSHARDLIESDEYVKQSDWSQAQPSADDENAFIERHGWDEFSKWHLAVDTDYDEDEKSRYHFPHGDLRRVHRSALIAVKQRAGKEDYGSIESAADDLLGSIPEPDE